MTRIPFSPEFGGYRRTLACPAGHGHSLTFVEGVAEAVEHLRLRDRLLLDRPFGRTAPGLRADDVLDRWRQRNHERTGALVIPRFRIDSRFACAVCDDSWPVFLHAEPVLLERRPTGRSQTPLGPQTQVFDHSRSDVDLRLETEFVQEWSARLDVTWERTSTAERTASASMKLPSGELPFDLTAEVRQRITRQLRETHSVVSEMSSTTRQRVELVLPARTVTTVTVSWSQVWQEYLCTWRMPRGEVLEVPYRVALDPTFDQTVHHEVNRDEG